MRMGKTRFRWKHHLRNYQKTKNQSRQQYDRRAYDVPQGEEA